MAGDIDTDSREHCVIDAEVRVFLEERTGQWQATPLRVKMKAKTSCVLPEEKHLWRSENTLVK